MNCWPSKSRWYGWLQGAALILIAGLWLLSRLGLAPAWAQASYFFHEVKPGETLWSISKAYGTSVERLEEFNGGERVGHSIKAGEFLVVPAEMLVVAQRMAVSPEALHKASAADAVLPDEVFAAPVRPSSVYDEDELLAIKPGSVFGASTAAPSAEGDEHRGVVPSAVVLGEAPAAVSKPAAPAVGAAGKGQAAPASGSKASSAAPKTPSSAPKAHSDKGLVAVAPASVFGSAAAPSGASQSTASPKPSGAQGQKAASGQAGGQDKTKGKASAKDADKAKAKGKSSAKDAPKAQDKAKGKASAKDADKAKDKGKGKASAKDAPKAQDKAKGKSTAKDSDKAQDKAKGQATKSVDEMLAFARKFIGTPYVYGGDTPAGFDCSGYVQSVCRYAGVVIPRVADEQYYKAGRPIPKGQEQAGDLVFFETDPSWPGPSHVGICLGGGEFIHASSSGSVRVDTLSKEYYRTRFLGSKRVIEQS